jgi:NagD protein
MDGVIVRRHQPIPGAIPFIERLQSNQSRFLILTNNPTLTPEELAARFERMGICLTPSHFYTSALATADFIRAQMPQARVFSLGEAALEAALRAARLQLVDDGVDYVVLGDMHNYNFARMAHAVRLVKAGARFIATNPEPSGLNEGELVPSCGAIASLIQAASGIGPYYVGKPNPLMVRKALQCLDEHAGNVTMIGDRMDTDIRAGTESGLTTVLVLTGETTREMIARYPYRPTHVLESLVDMTLDA